MSAQDLVKLGHEQLDEIIGQLKENLEVLRKQAEVRNPVQQTLEELEKVNTKGELATPFEQASIISNTLNFLRLVSSQRSQNSKEQLGWIENLVLRIFPRLAASQQSQSPNLQYLEQIDKLIQSCYKPVASVAHDRLTFMPEEILAVYFESEYLARPNAPVPFLLVPNYFEGNKPEDWITVGHETGHHVYRQLRGVKEEIEVIVTQALLRNKVSEAQQRLWFNWLEETFADIYGILTLGAASVYSLHLIIGNYASSDLEGLLKGQDETHPIPLVRGEMGVYIYEQLLQNPASEDLQVLQKEWKEITDKLVGKPILDPHTPKSPGLADKWNSSGNLDYPKTVGVMKLVVNTLLKSELRALGCKRLNELVDFKAEENIRLTQTLIPNPNADIRISVAARRLAKHRQ